MGKIVFNVLVIAAALALVATIPFAADLLVPQLERHARISVETAEHDRNVDFSDDAPVLEWLDELLCRIPKENPESGDTQGQEETEAASPQLEPEVRPEPEIAAEPIDPGFRKPPDISPLYLSPKLDGEGLWTSQDMPVDSDGKPLIYKTCYRPSLEFPNSIVYMALMDMSRLSTRLFIGQTEPGIYHISYTPEREDLSRIVAITNAMWMQQHARGAGAIFRGQVVYPMVKGMATLVVYRDDSVDVLEWTDEIPLSLVRDARQLRHLIVKDGAVVEEVVKHGKIEQAEIGLGGFLIDSQGRNTMGNKVWYLANRTAFGIRDDGNLVFAMGHHVGTRDLARALVLAGCKRAIHGDANIHNIVCNFFFRDEKNRIVKRDKLSPEQLQYTMKRYDQGYAKDFFAFYEK